MFVIVVGREFPSQRERVKFIDALKCHSSSGTQDRCREKLGAEELDARRLLSQAATKVHRDFVKSVVMDYGKAAVTWDRDIAG